MKRKFITIFHICILFLVTLVPVFNQPAKAFEFDYVHGKYYYPDAAGAIVATLWVADMTVGQLESRARQYVQLFYDPILGYGDGFEIGYIKGQSPDTFYEEDTGWDGSEYTGTQWYAMYIDESGPGTDTEFKGAATTGRDASCQLINYYFLSTPEIRGAAFDLYSTYTHEWEYDLDWQRMNLSVGVETLSGGVEFYGHFNDLEYWIPNSGWYDWDDRDESSYGVDMTAISDTEFTVENY